MDELQVRFVNRQEIVDYLLDRLSQEGSLTPDELDLLIGLTQKGLGLGKN